MSQKYTTHVVSGEIDEEDEPVQISLPQPETPKMEESNHFLAFLSFRTQIEIRGRKNLQRRI
jgi:hypothetical protein